jgi:hypothetical protein
MQNMQTHRLLFSMLVLTVALLTVGAFLDSPAPTLAQSFNPTSEQGMTSVITTTTPLPTTTGTATVTVTSTSVNTATVTATATEPTTTTVTPSVTATATATPSSRDTYLALIQRAANPTATPTVTPSPTPDPECNAYLDDFSDPNSGWGSRDINIYRRNYIDNEYQIFIKEPDYIIFVASPAGPNSTYTLEADLRWQGAPGFSYGLIFGINEDSDFYLFEVAQDFQEYAISYWPANGNPSLVTQGASGAIQPGNGVNHLEIRTNGSQQDFYINDTYLTTTNVNDSGARYTGISASAVGSSDVDARFDNYCITTPAGTTRPATSGSAPVLDLRRAPSYFLR